MNNLFDVLVYLDEILVKNISSLVLTGYIETQTLIQSFDKSLQAAISEGDKLENSNQGSVTRIEREGFKDRNCLDSNNNFENHHCDRALDAKQYIKEELRLQTTFTAFKLNGNLMSYLRENQDLHQKIATDIENDNIEAGDLIEIEGTITNTCVVTYVDTLMNIVNIFGCEYLDGLVKNCKCNITFDMFLKMLTYLKSDLECNNTRDLIMKTGNGIAVLTVNKTCFMSNRCNVFDNINCHCKVIGKVIKTCTAEEDSISLLRKTGQEKFYEKFLEKCKPLLDCLEENDIVLPECPDLRINEHAIQIMPLNIYM